MADSTIPSTPTSPTDASGEKVLELQLEHSGHVNQQNNTQGSEKDAEASAVANTGGAVDVPPDGGYGWVCVGAAFCINACTWGVNSSYGVFLSYYLNANPPKFPGGTPLVYAFIGGLTISQGLLISPLGTYLTRRFSSRVTLLLGVILEFSGLILASFAKSIWQLALTQGVLFGYGLGFLFVASAAIIPQWFTSKRSVANGISAAGSGVGGIAFNLICGAAIHKISLAWAFRITAFIVLVVNTTCSLLLRDRNKIINPTQRAFDVRLLARGEFHLVMAWGFFSMLGYVAILFSLPDYAISVGLSKSQASVCGAMLNLGMMFGRPLIGLFSDSFGRINMAGVMTFATAITVFVIWLFAKSYGVLIFFSILNGAVCGTFWTTIVPVSAEVVGMVELPSALSITWVSLVLPTTFSEVIALALRKSPVTAQHASLDSREYLYSQVFAGVMYLVASLCMYFLRVWKIGVDEKKVANKRASAFGALWRNESHSSRKEEKDKRFWEKGRWLRWYKC